MSKTNSKLAAVIGTKQPKTNLVNANKIPKPDATNQQGLPAYSQDKWLTLLTMLNTLKFEPQYYRSQTQTLKELQTLIDQCAKEDLYLTCQCIVYSRCLGEGMRTISHASSVFIAPYISGQEYSKRFYGLWNKKEQKGGVIFRPDDMAEILQGYIALNGQIKQTVTLVNGVPQSSETSTSGPKLSNAMKKGFKSVLESLDSYSLLKYKSKLIDIINLVHPSPKLSTAKIEYNGEQHYNLKSMIFLTDGRGIRTNISEKSKREGLKKYKKQLKRDENVRKYCKENNIILIEIPYTYNTYEKISEVLKRILIEGESPDIITQPKIIQLT